MEDIFRGSVWVYSHTITTNNDSPELCLSIGTVDASAGAGLEDSTLICDPMVESFLGSNTGFGISDSSRRGNDGFISFSCII